MAELERLANHIGDFGAICNDASFSIMLAHCAVLREKILRASAECFGHRLMMDRIVPGGVTVDLPNRRGLPSLQALVEELSAVMPRLTRLYDDTPSLQDRTVSNRHPASGTGAAVCARRLCRPSVGAGFRCAAGPGRMRPTTS